MADDAVVVDRSLTKGDYFKVLMLMTLRRPYVLVLMAISTVMLIIGIVADLYPAVFIFLFVLIFAYAPLTGLKVIYDRRSRSIYQPVRLTFREAGIEVASGQSKRTLDWDMYYDWQKLGSFYALVTLRHGAHVIPARDLSAADEERFVGLLRTRINDRV